MMVQPIHTMIWKAIRFLWCSKGLSTRWSAKSFLALFGRMLGFGTSSFNKLHSLLQEIWSTFCCSFQEQQEEEGIYPLRSSSSRGMTNTLETTLAISMQLFWRFMIWTTRLRSQSSKRDWRLIASLSRRYSLKTTPCFSPMLTSISTLRRPWWKSKRWLAQKNLH